MTMIDAEAQERVLNMIRRIFGAISMKDTAEAQTAMTIAVVAMCVAMTKDRAEAQSAAEGFYQTVLDNLDRKDIVEWARQQILLPH